MAWRQGGGPNDLFRAARLRLGWSQSQLADAANRVLAELGDRGERPVTWPYVSAVECGRVACPDPRRLEAFRQVLGVDTGAEIGLRERRGSR